MVAIRVEQRADINKNVLMPFRWTYVRNNAGLHGNDRPSFSPVSYNKSSTVLASCK